MGLTILGSCLNLRHPVGLAERARQFRPKPCWSSPADSLVKGEGSPSSSLYRARIAACVGAFALTIVVLSGTASAGGSATVFTTLILQVEDQPPNREVVVSADKQKQPTGEMKLVANLGAIPPLAQLKSCTLRLVTQSGLAAAEDNGVHLQLDATPAAKPPQPRQVGAQTIDPGTAPGATVILQTKGLCDSLKNAATVQFRLRTTTGNGRISFYGRPDEASSEAPRLLLTYEVPDFWPGRADWSQARADAQNSGRSAWRMSKLNGATTRTTFATFESRPLGKATFADVSPPVLLYNQQILAVSPDGAAVQIMNGDGAVARSISLPVKPKFIGVGRNGWFYDTGEDLIFARSLDGEGSITIDTKKETVLEPPTIGPDGSLYTVTNQYVYAYPAPPLPANVPLWRYRTGAKANNDVSAVALSEDGRTAYVVDKTSAQLIALDAATGAVKWKQAGLQISRGANEPMPVPVVAGDAIFVTNHAPAGSVLYIVADGGQSATLDSLSGEGITAPVVGPDLSVYYVRDARLHRLWRDPDDGKFKEQAAGGAGCDQKMMAGIDLLRADQSGDLYGVDRTGERIVYIRSNDQSVPAGACQPIPRSPLGASLAIAADGTAYTYTRARGLQAVVPIIQDVLGPAIHRNVTLTNEILKLSPDGAALLENNDTTFRVQGEISAENLTLPANANINIAAGNRITLGPGLRLATGVRLHASVGN